MIVLLNDGKCLDFSLGTIVSHWSALSKGEMESDLCFKGIHVKTNWRMVRFKEWNWKYQLVGYSRQ